MIRTGYSFRVAAGHLPDVMNRLKVTGWRAAPIADRCSTFGFCRWTKLAEKENMKPVYGVELACTPERGVNKPPLDYWTFLAKDSLRPLHDLIFLATKGRSEPMLTYAEALAASGLFKISGERVLLESITLPPKDFYVGLSPATSRGLYNAAKRANHQFCAMDNNYYPCPEDREFYRVMLGKNSNAQSYAQHIMQPEELRNALRRCGAHDTVIDEAIQNRLIILDGCNAKLKKATMITPQKTKTLRAMCEEGAALVNCDLSDPIYKERLDFELSMIEEKKFEDYFYVVAHLVQWAKERMVVGPGRGSSSGSLVCYLLRITAIDPIKYNLLFARFIDFSRTDLPDIDVDFCADRREMAFKYAEETYGKDRVARLGTVSMFGPKSLFGGVSGGIGAALRIPKFMTAKVLDSMILRSSGDSRAMMQIEDTFNETEAGRELLRQYPEALIAARMEGHPNNAGQHAAGIVITQESILEYVAIDGRTGAAYCDKKDAQDLGLLKIDALGLEQLSVFGRTLELIGKPNKSGELEQLPMNEMAAFNVLNNGNFSGIFQFTGRSLKNLVKQSGVRDIEDMVAITALARPGPMGSGGAGSWAKRRAGLEPVTYPHPLLEPYLKDTLGIIVMQEQVMQIGRELGGLSWKDVTALRKSMSQSLGEEFFDQFGDPWKKGVIEKGMPPEIAKRVWADLCKFGLWGFNRSHAVAYSVVSYWACWLKAHHPLEFAAATLDSINSTDHQLEFLRELAEEQINYVAVDPLHSTAKWTPVTYPDGRKMLVGPLTNVKGIGPVTVDLILKARAAGLPIPASAQKKLLDAQTAIDTLTPVKDCVQTNVPDLTQVNILTKPTAVKDVQCGINGDVVIIAVVNKIAPRDENEAINVAKRVANGWQGEYKDGMTKSINLFFRDDTDEIFCKINRFNYEKLGIDVVNRGKPGRAIYAVKGDVPRDFRMIRVKAIKYLCDLEERTNQHEDGGRTFVENDNL